MQNDTLFRYTIRYITQWEFNLLREDSSYFPYPVSLVSSFVSIISDSFSRNAQCLYYIR